MGAVNYMKRIGMKLNWRRIPSWVWRMSICILAPFLLAAIVYLLYEYIIILQQQPDEWFDRVRASLLTFVAVVGLPFLIWRTWIADRQNQISREGHYTEVFGKAVELLGATRNSEGGTLVPVVESRVGAIFSLERLSKISQTDYGSIVETLSAYVREQCGVRSIFAYEGTDPDEEGISAEEKSMRTKRWVGALQEWVMNLKQDPLANRADIAAALTVLSRRKEGRHWTAATNQGEVDPNLSGANLQGANLWAITKGFVDDVSIGGAHLEGAVLDGSCLEASSFVGFRVQHELTATRLVPRSLVGIFAMGLVLKNAHYFPILDGANLDLAVMDGVECNDARFRGARVVRANFKSSKLENAKFGVANASYAVFDCADLTQAEFLNALLEGASFVGANLSHAMFQYAVMYGVKLDGALLVGTDFSEARYLSPEIIDKAFGTFDVKLPVGMTHPSHWGGESSAIERWETFRASGGIRTAS